MKVWNRSIITSVCLLFTSPAFSEDADRYARRCQGHAPDRGWKPQGTSLWGTRQAWSARQQGSEQHSVLVSVELGAPLLGDARVRSPRLEDGPLVGTVLQGTSSDGLPVEVAVCGAEPAPEDPHMVWYRLEAWNPVAREWENPCVSTGPVLDPRALAVGGVWDSSGAHHDVPGKLTLACETGVITKCIRWGYKPWASQDGKSLARLHQACTRMARADYCGNGRSHTREGTIIDFYDVLGMFTPTTEASASWEPARASFEAAWAPDGATCLSHSRDGQALETILEECPERFRVEAPVELGQGDRCIARRADMSGEAALLRNRSYERPQDTPAQTGSK